MLLNEQLSINGSALRNRIVFGSHVNSLNAEAGDEVDIARCVPGERAAAYYQRRAVGGAALIITEEIPVTSSAFRFRAAADLSLAAFKQGLKLCSSQCHKNGALILARLSHPGAFADFDLSFCASLSPSGMAAPNGFHASQEMSETQIQDVINGFVEAAKSAVECGCDGVEIDAGPLSLIEQFRAPALNRRRDKWNVATGAELLVSNIINEVRKAIGPEKLISLSLAAVPDPAIGIDVEDRIDWLTRMDTIDGVDIMHMGLGTYSSAGGYPDDQDEIVALLAKLPNRRKIRLLSGAILTTLNAETLLKQGLTDLIGMARALIADPDLPNHVMQGTPSLTRPCVACNQHCRDRIARNYSITCLVNPAAGREARSHVTLAQHPQQVTVIGGGAAGLEAALASAQRGHQVRLHERTGQVGGQLLQIARQPMRHGFGNLLDWYKAQLQTYQVEVLTNSNLSPDDIPTGAKIIIATGSKPDLNIRHRGAPHELVLPGHNLRKVHPVEDVMTGKIALDGDILIFDDCDDWKGLGTALYLAEAGHVVSLVTRQGAPGKRILPSGAVGKIRKRFADLGVKELCGWTVQRWTSDAAELLNLNTGLTETRKFDWLLTATTSRANTEFANILAQAERPHLMVGDCASPRNVGDAIREGRAAAKKLETMHSES